MKELKFLLFCFLGFVVFSCNINESISINKDGSILYSTGVGMSPDLFKAMMGTSEFNGKESFDSIIYFKDILQEEVPENIAKEDLKVLEDAKLMIHFDKSKDEMSFDFVFNAKNTDDLMHRFFVLNKIMKSKNENQPYLKNMDFLSGNNRFKYSYDGNFFQKVVDFSKLTAEEIKEYKESVESLEQEMKTEEGSSEVVNLLKNSEIYFQYNFPKKVKEVNLPEAEILNNGKTVSLKMNALEYFKNIEQYNLLIELE